jgi:two-component system, NtrC family, response regulator HydG
MMSEMVSVLIVDEIPSMAETLADVLDAKGFQAYPANSGAQALEILREHAVNVLLSDVIMPEMNSLALYRIARKTHPDLMIILMTAYAADDLIQQGMKEGIKTVLSKPVDLNLLISIPTAVGRLKRG